MRGGRGWRGGLARSPGRAARAHPAHPALGVRGHPAPYGDTLPLDAYRGTGFDKIGCTVRQPVGVVVAITPFDFPSRLVLHKIGPAPAAGNAGVLKPARSTPLTALALAACFVDAGLPEGVLSVLTVPGRLARRPAPDPPGRKVSFSGLTGIGERIAARTGVSGTPPT